MRYYKPITFALMFLILALLALCLAPGCAMLQTTQPLQSYTFNYDGMSYSALLPKEVPLPSENAVQDPFCWNWLGPLCAIHVLYVYDGKDLVTTFWFTQERGVLALVHHMKLNGKTVHTPYLYIKGLPVKVEPGEIQDKLNEWLKGPK